MATLSLSSENLATLKLKIDSREWLLHLIPQECMCYLVSYSDQLDKGSKSWYWCEAIEFHNLHISRRTATIDEKSFFDLWNSSEYWVACLSLRKMTQDKTCHPISKNDSHVYLRCHSMQMHQDCSSKRISEGIFESLVLCNHVPLCNLHPWSLAIGKAFVVQIMSAFALWIILS